MRYFIVNYIQTPNGQFDELVTVAKNIKPKDLQEARVILDFKTNTVVKAALKDKEISRDWGFLSTYYEGVYSKTITQLKQNNQTSVL